MTYDLVVTGGEVLDPGAGLVGRQDLGIKGDAIAAVAPSLSARACQAIDARGLLVLPGFIDLHTHIYWGSTYYGLRPEPVAAATGVTTWVDAGSAGAYTFPGFNAQADEAESVHTRAFINISCVGLAARVRESAVPEFLDTEACVRTARAFPDRIVGVKVRSSAKPTGSMGVRPLRRALEAAEQLGLPVMAHIGNAPPELSEVMPLLRRGDVLTHCFTGHGMTIADDANRLRHFAQQARDRGVWFDVGHGSGSFSFAVAEAAAHAGVWPDVISTDVHQFSAVSKMRDLATCMSKLLMLGMPLPDVIEAVTATPAAIIGMSGEVGTLRPGASADVVLASVEEGAFPVHDIDGTERVSDKRLVVHATIAKGRVLTPGEAVSVPWGPSRPGEEVNHDRV